MDDRTVSNGDVTSNRARQVLIAVEDGIVLDVAPGSDPNWGHIPSHRHVEPDAGARTDLDIPDDGRSRRNESVSGNPWPDSVVR
jgi:hypothetical protein